jgi:hypothetical protein
MADEGLDLDSREMTVTLRKGVHQPFVAARTAPPDRIAIEPPRVLSSKNLQSRFSFVGRIMNTVWDRFTLRISTAMQCGLSHWDEVGIGSARMTSTFRGCHDFRQS